MPLSYMHARTMSVRSKCLRKTGRSSYVDTARTTTNTFAGHCHPDRRNLRRCATLSSGGPPTRSRASYGRRVKTFGVLTYSFTFSMKKYARNYLSTAPYPEEQPYGWRRRGCVQVWPEFKRPSCPTVLPRGLCS